MHGTLLGFFHTTSYHYFHAWFSYFFFCIFQGYSIWDFMSCFRVFSLSKIRLHFDNQRKNLQGFWAGKQFDEVIILHTWHIGRVIESLIPAAADRAIHKVWWFVHILQWVSRKDAAVSEAGWPLPRWHWPHRDERFLSRPSPQLVPSLTTQSQASTQTLRIHVGLRRVLNSWFTWHF